jgi:hypothetical protein
MKEWRFSMNRRLVGRGWVLLVLAVGLLTVKALVLIPQMNEARRVTAIEDDPVRGKAIMERAGAAYTVLTYGSYLLGAAGILVVGIGLLRGPKRPVVTVVLVVAILALAIVGVGVWGQRSKQTREQDRRSLIQEEARRRASARSAVGAKPAAQTLPEQKSQQGERR